MTKLKTTIAATKRLKCALRVVELCQRVANKRMSAAFTVLIAELIVAKVPARFMRRLLKGDCGRPMFEAMKLTIPYIIRSAEVAR